MRNFGVGIIGSGSIAQKHAQAVQMLENAELLAVFNPRSESALLAEKAFGVNCLTDLNEFLDLPNLDIVCICTPSGLHLEPALAAAKAGKHILVEKPIEINLNRTDQLIESCEEHGVKLAVVFQNRFSPDYQKLKTAITQGKFGKLLMGNAYVNWFRDEGYYSGSNWKGTLEIDGGGAFINQAIHTIDLLLDCMGDVESVFGQVKTLSHQIEAEDTGSALVNFKNGAIGNVTAATSLFPGYPERLEIYGNEGSAILSGGKLTEWNIRGEEGLTSTKQSFSTSGSSDPSAIGFQLHLAQWRLFLKAIEEDLPKTVNGKTARKSVELISAIYTSSKLGKLITLPLK